MRTKTQTKSKHCTDKCIFKYIHIPSSATLVVSLKLLQWLRVSIEASSSLKGCTFPWCPPEKKKETGNKSQSNTLQQVHYVILTLHRYCSNCCCYLICFMYSTCLFLLVLLLSNMEIHMLSGSRPAHTNAVQTKPKVQTGRWHDSISDKSTTEITASTGKKALQIKKSTVSEWSKNIQVSNQVSCSVRPVVFPTKVHARQSLNSINWIENLQITGTPQHITLVCLAV